MFEALLILWLASLLGFTLSKIEGLFFLRADSIDSFTLASEDSRTDYSAFFMPPARGGNQNAGPPPTLFRLTGDKRNDALDHHKRNDALDHRNPLARERDTMTVERVGTLAPYGGSGPDTKLHTW